MKVLMLSWEYPPHNVGGLGKHVTDLVPALSNLGVEVHLLTPRWGGGYDQEIVEDSAVVYRVAPADVNPADFFVSAWRTNVNLENKARELIEENGDFDLIHAHDWLVSFAAVALKHSYKMPLLATIHATEHGRGRGQINGALSRAIHGMEWWLSYEAWRIICCSQYMMNEIATVFQAPSDKMDVIRNGVDERPFAALRDADLSAFRAQYALPWERIVLHVGRIVEEKGAHILVEAAPRILTSAPETKFIIVGTGGHLDGLRHRASELGLGEKLIFTGWVPDEVRDRLITVADVAVFPSLYEPFGIVALEAMVAQRPVVVTNVGGLAEVVDHGVTGQIVFPNSVDSLAWGVLEVLRQPEQAAMRAGTAYRMATEEYNWERVAQRTAEVYERVSAERRATVW